MYPKYQNSTYASRNTMTSTAEQLWTEQLNQQGYRFVDFSVNGPPSIVAIDVNGAKTFIDSSTGRVFQNSAHINTVFNNTGNSYYSSIAPTNKMVQIRKDIPSWAAYRPYLSPSVPPTPPQSYSSSPSYYTESLPKAMDWQYQIPRRADPGPPPPSPTQLTADTDFNDALYMSLQGDMLPPGSNPLDDYLNSNGDSRMRIYMDAVIGNQGCCCEMTDLDRYLKNNKDLYSTIILRATLSDECRRFMQEPVNTKPVLDQVHVMQNIIDACSRHIREYTNTATGFQQNSGPWMARCESPHAMSIH